MRAFLGYSGAAVTVALALLSPFLLFGWFQNAIAAMRLRINPGYSGGELSHVIQRDGYRIAVNHPVWRRSPFQRVDSFVQLTFTPAARLPAQFSEAVDLDGDSTPDVVVRIDTAGQLEVNVTPLNARYHPMHSKGVTSFAALIARVRDGVIVRIPL
jgi:hypothetical protein